MALPIIATPTYSLKLPSTDEPLTYRPFLVKEQKILLIAKESNDRKQIRDSIRQVLLNCTDGKFDAFHAPIFDMEYVFIKVRGKSVGDMVNVKLLCADDGKTYVEKEIDLNDVEVQMDEDHDNKIVINDTIDLIMTYPTFMSSMDTEENVKATFGLILDCIQAIHEKKGDETIVHEKKDMSKKELTEWFESLNEDQLTAVQKFLETMPRAKYQTSITNPNTGVENDIELVGIHSFFT